MILGADIDFEKYLHKHETNKHAQHVRPMGDFLDDAIERLHNGVAITGDAMPWDKTQDKFRFRHSEMTIWSGVNGNGKSLVMGQCALWLATHTGVCIASMEMTPESTVARMLRQASGSDTPTREFGEAVINLLDGKMFIYDQVGSVSRDAILGAIHYAAKDCNVKHFMIDSLVKCGIGTDDFNGQKNFVDKLANVAKEHSIHVHLVVHIRKGESETAMPDKFDIKGAGEITDLADNVLIIARNMKKEKLKREKKDFDEGEPDGFIRVAKQRHGEWEGLWGFWWHDKSQQWISKQTTQAMPYPHPLNQLSAIPSAIPRLIKGEV